MSSLKFKLFSVGNYNLNLNNLHEVVRRETRGRVALQKDIKRIPIKLIIRWERLGKTIYVLQNRSREYFAFRSVRTSNVSCDIHTAEEVFSSDGFILAVVGDHCSTENESDFNRLERLACYKGYHAYKPHASIEDASWHTNYPAYTNHERDSDSIGYSSWSGSLVRFLQAGYTTRIQYAVKAGLFPEDE